MRMCNHPLSPSSSTGVQVGSSANTPNPTFPQDNGSISTTMIPDLKYCTSLKISPIFIDESALENILLRNADIVEKKQSWATPLGIGLTCLIALLTSTFKEFLGFSGDTWTAVFIICLMICAILVIKALISVVKNWNNGGVDDLMSKIKSKAENKLPEKIN